LVDLPCFIFEFKKLSLAAIGMFLASLKLGAELAEEKLLVL